MLEIKLTISLDEKTADTLDRLIGALNKEVTKVAETEETPEKKKAKAPIKATAAPIEEAKDGTTDSAQNDEAENIGIEELRTLLASAKREKGTDAIKAILKGYGVSLLSDLDPSHYAEVAQKVREL